MSYTVKQLAKLSGVSVRTLHFYDEIDLLSPAFYGENKYRYYEKDQLLLLQQILFYRELGFPLNKIQKIVKSSDFDKVKALDAHKQLLLINLEKTHALIKTIDKTISHIRGIENMKDEELYYGFDSEKQKQYEKNLIEEGVVSESGMKKWKKQYMTEEQKQQFFDEMKKVNDALVEAVKNNLSPSSKEVQAIILRHHRSVGWNPTREGYIGLSERYQTPEFRKFYDALHPQLVEFLVEAMRVFADEELS